MNLHVGGRWTNAKSRQMREKETDRHRNRGETERGDGRKGNRERDTETQNREREKLTGRQTLDRRRAGKYSLTQYDSFHNKAVRQSEREDTRTCNRP